MPHADPETDRKYHREYQRRRRAALKAAGKPELPHLSEDERRARRSEYTKASTYGVSTAELRRWYAYTWARQEGRCAICAAEFVGSAEPVSRVYDKHAKRTGQAYVDHDHDTGKLRGLLCHRCNLQVGYVEKDTALAIKAVDYVLNALDSGWPEG